MKKTITLLFFLIFIFTMFGGHILAGQKTYIYFYIQSSFNTDSEIKFTLGGKSYNEATINLYKVNFNEVMNIISTKYDNKEKIKIKDKKLVKSWIEKVTEEKWGVYKYLTLKPLPAGAYILEGKAGNAYTHSIFIVSDLTLLRKTDDHKSLIYAVNAKTGAPQANALIRYYKNKTTGLVNSFTNKNGLLLINEKITTSSTIIASSGEHHALLNYYAPYFYNYYYYKVYTYTDRPIYRPGQKVNFKGIIREKTGNISYKIPDSKQVNIEIKTPKGDSIYKKAVNINNFGTFEGGLQLPEEAQLGQYYMTITYNKYSFYSYFRVEEYRKPEYKLVINTNKKSYIQKEKISFNIKALYYFGEPLKKADVSYKITRANHYTPWWRDYYYPWYFEDDDYYDYYSWYGYEVQSGKGTTDEKGNLTVDYKLPSSNATQEYTIVVTVKDKSNREVIDSNQVLVYPSNVKLELATNRYFYSPYEPVQIKLQTKNLKDEFVNSKVSLNIYRQQYKKGKYYEDLITEYACYTNNGIATYSFTPTKEGYYRIVGKALDSYGNETEYTKYVYVFKHGGYDFYWGSDLEIILDKTSYKPGDIAKVLITSSVDDQYILLTVEGESLAHYQVLHVKNSCAYAEIRITKDFCPNAFIYATRIGNNTYNYKLKKIVVPPEDNFLNVKITSDKETYKPGEEAYFKVTIKDNHGRPVQAELSLGVVDESIYALHKDNTVDIRKFFYGITYNKVQTIYSYWYYFSNTGQIEDMSTGVGGIKEKSSPKKSTAGIAKEADSFSDEKDLIQPKLREFFPDTAYWGASIKTNAQGIGYAKFKVPDTLTTWRATSRVISRDTKVGQITYDVLSRKNLIVRPSLPRFFTQGDEEKITAIVHNYLNSSKKVYLKLEAPGIELKEPSEKSIYLEPNTDVKVEWAAKAVKAGKSKIRITALTNEESDAVEISVPIQPYGIATNIFDSGEIEKELISSFNITQDAISETIKLNIAVAPSLVSTMFSSLEYLVGYPYGCVEQTMSRFLPDIIVAQVYKKLGKTLPPELEKNLPLYVKKGFERLYDLQNDDGSWGWWKYDNGNPYLTAYAMFGLFKAREAGYLVNSDVYKSGLSALQKLLKVNTDINTKCYMLYVLSEIGERDKNLAGDLYWKRGLLKNHYAKALLSIILKKHNMLNNAKTVIGELEDSATKIGQNSVYWGGRKSYYSWMDNKIENTAYVLKAFIEVDPKNQIIKKIIRYLITSKRGNYWYSTKDTAAAVMAMIDYVVRFENIAPSYTLDIFANEKLIKTIKITPEDFYNPEQKITLSPSELYKGQNTIRIVKNGEGNCYYSNTLTYFKSVEKITANNSGIEVKRYYSTDGNNFTKEPPKVKVGQELYVKVSIKSDVNYEYLMLEDYLPSAFEVVRERTSYDRYYYSYWWFVCQEIRDNRMVFFSSYFYKGERTFVYRIKPEIPGTMKWLPAKAQLMYFPEVQGNSDEAVITVEP